MESCDVAIVGAGPFGLAAAAHLFEIKGLETKVFGQPMSFWERCMPPRMLLRSHWQATHIAAPGNQLTLDEFASRNGNSGLAEPIPVSAFIHYGRWFHDQAGVHADPRRVLRVERDHRGFALSLEDGASLRTRRVLMATGIENYPYKPEIFRHIPRRFASHASELRNYAAFRNQQVIVIGGGQSALESAAFLHEEGAQVEILVRASSCASPRSSLLKRMIDANQLKFLYGRGGVGSAGLSLLIQQPHLYSYLPEQRRALWDRKSTKLGFSYRLVPPLNGTPVRYAQCVERAEVRGDRVYLKFGDETERAADHVVFGTGYKINLRKCELLGPAIQERLELVNGYPVLAAGLESSVPGLHFLGAPAAYSFGPLLRFVAGTEFAARAVARRLRKAKNLN